MSNAVFLSIVLAGPLAFLVTALYSRKENGIRPKRVIALSYGASILSVVSAAVSGFFVTFGQTWYSSLLGWSELGISIRLDALSILMQGMIALLAVFIMRFSVNYLDGDQRQGAFLGRLAASFAAVQLLVISGNLFVLVLTWMLSSMALSRLLLFYSERAGARVAARKKFIMARCSDALLILAAALLYMETGSGNLEVIFTQMREYADSGLTPASVEWAALALAGSALFKSAQFPFHGWLIEVMETPTPVSALLHAGLLNAGPFLMIRMAYVLEATSVASILLMVFGALTALYGSVVFLTQTSVKTALGYSSIAHMGFSLMVCGTGAYAAAMLHLVAHSFYKAHAFLSSGSIIDQLRGMRIALPESRRNVLSVISGTALGVAVYLAAAALWGVSPSEEPILFLLGFVIIMGMSRLFTSVFDRKAGMGLTWRISLMGLVLAGAFFTFESLMQWILKTQLPEVGFQTTRFGLLAGILLVFAAVTLIQILAPYTKSTPFTRALTIHIKNGFYVGAVTDVVMGGWRQFDTQAPVQVSKSLPVYKKPEEIREVYEEQFS